MPNLSYKNGSLYYEEMGSGDISIVFVHGNIASLNYWKKLRPFIPTNIRSFFLDMPGYGKSDNIPPFNLESFADSIKYFGESLNLEKYIFVGHSTGGLIGGITVLKGAPIEKLILISTVPFTGYPLTEDAKAAFNFLMTNRDFLIQVLRDHVFPGISDENLASELIQDAIRAIPHGYTDVPESLGKTNILSEFKNVKTPLYFIHGLEDKVIPFDWAKGTYDNLNGKLFTLKGAGHTPQISMPQEISTLISNIIKEK